MGKRETAQRQAARYGLVTAMGAGLTGAKALVEAAAIMREYLGGSAYDWDRLRVVTTDELEEARRIAERHDREHPFPIEAIRVNVETGHIVGVLMRQVTAVKQRRPVGSTRRPARRRASRRVAAGSANRDPDRPRRTCLGCGVEFAPSAPKQRYHSADCSNAARQRRFKDRRRKAEATDAIVKRARVEIRELERYKRRHDELVREAGKPGELRAHVEALAARRLEIWSLLPSANGDRATLRAEVERIEREIAAGWFAIRDAEAVAA